MHMHDKMPPMSTQQKFIATWTPRLLSLLRIVAAFMFMIHGTQKLLGFPVPRDSPTTLMSLSGAAGLLELVGGALLLVGLFTRPVAFLLSG
jgi:putative oxidoreductase